MPVRREDAELKRVVPRLPKQIDIDNLRSLVFWSRRFGITPAQLRWAVSQVGDDVLAVARYVGHDSN